MARKDLMKGLMGENTPDEAPARVDAARPRYTKGAIGAVSRSIEDLKRRSIVEVDARMIDAGGFRDRLDEDADLKVLISSIEEYGQQVPVLLRVNPNNAERYQIVYGRRRVAALKALGQPIKALIRDLNDEALVLAQGQENAARKDLTFIEKANFARQMRDAGYDRKIICDALAMDKTLISRLLSQIKTTDGSVMAEVARKGGKTVLSLPSKTNAGFDDWLVENLPEIHRSWKTQSGE